MFFKLKMSFRTVFLLFVLLNASYCEKNDPSSVDEFEEETESIPSLEGPTPDIHKLIDMATDFWSDLMESEENPLNTLRPLIAGKKVKSSGKKMMDEDDDKLDNLVDTLKKAGLKFIEEFLGTKDAVKDSSKKEKSGKGKTVDQKKRTEL